MNKEIKDMTEQERMELGNTIFADMDEITGGALTQTTPFTAEEMENTTGYERALRMLKAMAEYTEWRINN